MRPAAETINQPEHARLEVRRASDVLTLVLSGAWLLRFTLPSIRLVEEEMDKGGVPKRIEFDASSVSEWDTGLVSFVLNCQDLCRDRGVSLAPEGLPDGVRKLHRLAIAVPEAKDAKRTTEKAGLLARIGQRGIDFWNGTQELLEFLGSTVLAFTGLFRGVAQFRWADVIMVIQRCGPEALGIVALINFLVGVILAFVGAVQLSNFGASIFVADLVAIGTVREMGCLMTGVIICGRTGAAFAAELGAMKVNEEISAFKGFGISPMEFLVLPRILGLFLMMPLLCVFADVIGIAGGFVVSIPLLDVNPTEYLRRTMAAITVESFLLGVVKSAVFGIIVAVFGCLRGMHSGNNAAAVGQATTSAVVSGITAIVAADGIFAVLCNALGI